ncbi:MAG: hypothetical protein WCE58_13705 [Gallionella sp.]
MAESENKLELELSSLREEIRKAEEARLDFLKYKLIAVATLAAVAFGLGSWGSTDPDMEPRYILAVIPFVCVYVDTLCYHNNLRILVIAKYLRCHYDPYERFLFKWGQILEKDTKPARFFFMMEDRVLDISTKTLAVLVIVAGIVSVVNLNDCFKVTVSSATEGAIIALSGLMGFIISRKIKSEYDERERRIDGDSCEEIKAVVIKSH